MSHRQVRIERLDLVPHGRRYAGWIAGGANVQRHSGLMILPERRVNDRPWTFAQGAILGVADHCDDFRPRSTRAAKADVFGHCFLILEILSRESLVHDHDGWRAFL